MANINHAVNVDSVDNPTLDEYKQLIENGNKLVVVLETSEEITST